MRHFTKGDKNKQINEQEWEEKNSKVYRETVDAATLIYVKLSEFNVIFINNAITPLNDSGRGFTFKRSLLSEQNRYDQQLWIRSKPTPRV